MSGVFLATLGFGHYPLSPVLVLYPAVLALQVALSNAKQGRLQKKNRGHDNQALAVSVDAFSRFPHCPLFRWLLRTQPPPAHDPQIFIAHTNYPILFSMYKAATLVSVAAAGIVAYAVYFDYSRRSSPDFRRKLKKRAAKQEHQKAKAQEETRKARMNAVKKVLADDLAANPLPTDITKKEEFFMLQVATGEQLANNPESKTEAALAFYKALAVYPNPTDIMGIYQKTVPEDVYELLVMMIAFQPPATISNIIGGAGGISGAASAAAVATEELKPDVALD